jgi:hypothetical protein
MASVTNAETGYIQVQLRLGDDNREWDNVPLFTLMTNDCKGFNLHLTDEAKEALERIGIGYEPCVIRWNHLGSKDGNYLNFGGVVTPDSKNVGSVAFTLSGYARNLLRVPEVVTFAQAANAIRDEIDKLSKHSSYSHEKSSMAVLAKDLELLAGYLASTLETNPTSPISGQDDAHSIAFTLSDYARNLLNIPDNLTLSQAANVIRDEMDKLERRTERMRGDADFSEGDLTSDIAVLAHDLELLAGYSDLETVPTPTLNLSQVGQDIIREISVNSAIEAMESAMTVLREHTVNLPPSRWGEVMLRRAQARYIATDIETLRKAKADELHTQEFDLARQDKEQLALSLTEATQILIKGLSIDGAIEAMESAIKNIAEYPHGGMDKIQIGHLTSDLEVLKTIKADEGHVEAFAATKSNYSVHGMSASDLRTVLKSEARQVLSLEQVSVMVLASFALYELDASYLDLTEARGSVTTMLKGFGFIDASEVADGIMTTLGFENYISHSELLERLTQHHKEEANE